MAWGKPSKLPVSHDCDHNTICMSQQVNRNCSKKTSKHCETDEDKLFQNNMINWSCSFCKVIESVACEENSKIKLIAYVDIASESNETNFMLLTSTKVHVKGSFFPKLKCSSFRNCVHLGMGYIDIDCFTESENSDLSRDAAGPKSNHKLYAAADATINHVKNR